MCGERKKRSRRMIRNKFPTKCPLKMCWAYPKKVTTNCINTKWKGNFCLKYFLCVFHSLFFASLLLCFSASLLGRMCVCVCMVFFGSRHQHTKFHFFVIQISWWHLQINSQRLMKVDDCLNDDVETRGDTVTRFWTPPKLVAFLKKRKYTSYFIIFILL